MPGVVLRTFHSREFPIDRVRAAKGDTTIGVCLPARNEAETVGAIIETIRRDLADVVDDLVVVDDGSTDATAAVADAAGARVLSGPPVGKGDALRRSLHATDTDLVVWCDADIRGFTSTFVTGLVGPLLTSDDVGFVKGFYERPLNGRLGEGGRVTELVARPILSLLFPALTEFVQPLAGECAGRRDVLRQVTFERGYGVDVGMLIDVAARFGTASMAQVDLGVRVHRNRPLDELAPQATDVLAAVLARAGVRVADERVA